MPNSRNEARRAWIAARQKHMKPGTFCFIDIKHDDFCLMYTSMRVCNCNPTRILKDENGKILACVENMGPYHPIEFLEGLL